MKTATFALDNRGSVWQQSYRDEKGAYSSEYMKYGRPSEATHIVHHDDGFRVFVSYSDPLASDQEVQDHFTFLGY